MIPVLSIGEYDETAATQALGEVVVFGGRVDGQLVASGCEFVTAADVIGRGRFVSHWSGKVTGHAGSIVFGPISIDLSANTQSRRLPIFVVAKAR